MSKLKTIVKSKYFFACVCLAVFLIINVIETFILIISSATHNYPYDLIYYIIVYGLVPWLYGIAGLYGLVMYIINIFRGKDDTVLSFIVPFAIVLAYGATDVIPSICVGERPNYQYLVGHVGRYDILWWRVDYRLKDSLVDAALVTGSRSEYRINFMMITLIILLSIMLPLIKKEVAKVKSIKESGKTEESEYKPE